MPDYFTHYIAAEEIFSALGGGYREIIARDKELYLLGAQGGDVFFFYGLSYKNNAGRLLHREQPQILFERLKEGNAAYCAGWATHYALDSCVHPFVLAYEGAHRGAFLHQKYEKDLGLYVSRRAGVRRMILPREKVLACTFAVCDSIKKVLPYVTAAGTASCLKRHYAYTRRQLKTKKQEFELDCDYSQTYKAYQNGVTLGIRAVQCVLEKDIDEEVFAKGFYG